MSGKANFASLGKAVFRVAVASCPLTEGFEVFGADFDVSPLGKAAGSSHAGIVSYHPAGGFMEGKIFAVDAPVGVDDKAVGMGFGPCLVLLVVVFEDDDGF